MLELVPLGDVCLLKDNIVLVPVDEFLSLVCELDIGYEYFGASLSGAFDETEADPLSTS